MGPALVPGRHPPVQLRSVLELSQEGSDLRHLSGSRVIRQRYTPMVVAFLRSLRRWLLTQDQLHCQHIRGSCHRRRSHKEQSRFLKWS